MIVMRFFVRPCPSKLGRGSRSYGFREHQQAIPLGASEHRDAQPRPEQVLTPHAKPHTHFSNLFSPIDSNTVICEIAI